MTVLVRGDDFTCAGSIADEVKRHEQITVLYNTALLEVGGGDVLRYAVYENCKTGERTRYETPDATFGVFVFAGYVPVGGPLLEGLTTDCEGYLVTDMNQKTNLDGVYGAGDLCIKNLRQVVTAVSDGAKAATSLEKHAAMLHDKLQLPRFTVTKNRSSSLLPAVRLRLRLLLTMALLFPRLSKRSWRQSLLNLPRIYCCGPRWIIVRRQQKYAAF